MRGPQNGWDLSAFKRNPVILAFHDSASLPVGKATSVGVQDGKLTVGVKFAQTEFAKAVTAMLSGGYMRAVSVGFAPTEWAFAKAGSRQGGIDFNKQELLEVSVVPVPANAACLLTGIEGKSLSLKDQRRRTPATFKLANTPEKRKRLLVLELDQSPLGHDAAESGDGAMTDEPDDDLLLMLAQAVAAHNGWPFPVSAALHAEIITVLAKIKTGSATDAEVEAVQEQLDAIPNYGMWKSRQLVDRALRRRKAFA